MQLDHNVWRSGKAGRERKRSDRATESVKFKFTDLNTVIDGIHAVFEHFETNGHIDMLDSETIQRTKLAVHEWVANLVQHANFAGRVPMITLDIWPNGRSIECQIEDNSDGFDLDSHLMMGHGLLAPFPERGMGLLMIQACAESLYYGAIDDTTNRLKFSVPVDDDPQLDIPLDS